MTSMVVLDQKGGVCTGMAIANAVESQFSVIPTGKNVYDYYKKQGWDLKEGVRIFNFLQRMKREPFMGVLVDNYECIYNSRKKQNKLWRTKLAQSILDPEIEVIFGLRLREHKKGEKAIPLDHIGNLRPYKTRVVGYHAIHVCNVVSNHSFRCENSWGTDFGLGGYFYMDIGDIETECEQIYIVTFKDGPISC